MPGQAASTPPGTVRPRRFLPRFHYELLVCGLRGHERGHGIFHDLRRLFAIQHGTLTKVAIAVAVYALLVRASACAAARRPSASATPAGRPSIARRRRRVATPAPRADDPAMRSVEQIRERVLSRLADAYAADAVSVVTLEQRATDALSARTREELAGCVWDLPAGRSRHGRGDAAHPLRLIVETEPPVTIAWPPEARSLVIGRGSSGDLGVTDLTVSRRHAELSRRGGRLRVRDLGSLNGTTVNGRPIEVASLRRGDVLTLGALAIRVR